MRLYSIKKGNCYFKGNKMQPIIIQLPLTIIGVLLAVVFNNLWFLFASAIIFSAFSGIIKSESISDPFMVYFFPNCTYILNKDYGQVNRLYGFSEGFYKWNSAMIGWRCLDNKNIELLACCYINKKKVIKPLISCSAEKWILCDIKSEKNKYVFKAVSLDKESVMVSIDKEKKFSYYSLFKLFIYKLYPYFGNKSSSPKDMDLYITKLY